jgi:single-strand DNA-binding protein
MVVGHLGKDCTVNTVNGKSVINFNVAHSESYADAQGAKVEKTTWFQCAYWTDKTKVSEYLKKGTMVFVEGRVDVRTYTDQQGVTKASLELRVNMVNLLAQPKDQAAAGAPAPQNGAYVPPAVGAYDPTKPIDDLPF